MIEGVFSYDILANPKYQEMMQYVPVSTEDRARYIIDNDDDEENDEAQSDLIRLVLNIAYLTEERAINFTFGKDSYKGIGKAFGNIMQNQVNNTRIGGMGGAFAAGLAH
jgi:hypothetical protein